MLKWISSLLRRKCQWVATVQSCSCSSDTHYQIVCSDHFTWFTGHISKEKAEYVAGEMTNSGRRCG